MNTPACVMVTGASRGIGRACCDLLASHDIHTVSLSRTPPACIPDTETHYPIDLGDLPATMALVRTILKTHLIDGVVCNAGRGDIGSLENFSAQQIHQSILFNLISPLSLVRECLPHLRSRSRSNIVFIGSTSALQGARYGTVYSAAKFGLRGVAQALTHEVASANCHVGIVNPGSVSTDFFNELDFEPGPEPSHSLQANDVAHSVLQLLRSPDNAVVSEINVQPRQHVIRKRPAANSAQDDPERNN
ncbi:MAG: SDR family oxidoreductase [Granulosicoccus sp.]